MTEINALLRADRGFRPLLFEGDAQAISSAVVGWAEAGLTARTLRGRKMRTLRGLFDEFAAALQFPLYFGENMDAFDECISELETLPAGEGYVLIIVEPDQVLADAEAGALEWLAGSLRSAAEEWGRPVELGEWWDRPALPFHVVLAGQRDEIEGAVRRWSSAGVVPMPFAQSKYRRPANAAMFPEPFSIHLGVEPAEMSRLEETARSRGLSVFRLDFTGLEDGEALVDYLATAFMFPQRVVGLDAALDLISDLEWFGNDRGYLVAVDGSASAPVAAELFASLLPNIVDRWRTQDGVPFLVVMDGNEPGLRAALLAANRFMEEAATLPWAQPGIGRVDVVVHDAYGSAVLE